GKLLWRKILSITHSMPTPYEIFDERTQTVIVATDLPSLVVRLKQHYVRSGFGNLDHNLILAVVCERYPDECEPQSMTWLQAAKNFVASMKAWNYAGRPIVNDELFEHRKEICSECEHRRGWRAIDVTWCSLCKCGTGGTSLKLRMETEKCPAFKW